MNGTSVTIVHTLLLYTLLSLLLYTLLLYTRCLLTASATYDCDLAHHDRQDCKTCMIFTMSLFAPIFANIMLNCSDLGKIKHSTGP